VIGGRDVWDVVVPGLKCGRQVAGRQKMVPVTETTGYGTTGETCLCDWLVDKTQTVALGWSRMAGSTVD
jgi:hypothetical protein